MNARRRTSPLVPLLMLSVCASTSHAQQSLRSTTSEPRASATNESSWSHAARGPDRVSTVDLSSNPNPSPLGATRLTTTTNTTPDGFPIVFMTRTSPVIDGHTAYALAFVNGYESLVAVDLLTARVNWAAELPPLEVDSWSSPAIDAEHHAVLVGMGDELIAFGARTGHVRWRTALLAPIVNASPVVTTDLGPRDRVFLTDYGYFSDAGRLYCLNTDPFDPALNPYQPGDIVWSVPIDNVSSGNSPAYANGLVFVATPGDGFGGPGHILAFDATTDAPPSPAWVFTNPLPRGFFGGVSVRDGLVHAASYGFSGGQLNSNLVRLRAHDGSLVWSAPSNRTSSTPVPLADGRVVLGAGLLPDPVFGDYGSRPSVAVYAPTGARQLETALDTWTDLDNDNSIDPGEALLLSNWTDQPLVLEHPSGHAEAIVARPASANTPSLAGEGLARINLDWKPTSPAPLILQSSPLGGGSCAYSNGWLVSLGPNGMTIWRPRIVGGLP